MDWLNNAVTWRDVALFGAGWFVYSVLAWLVRHNLQTQALQRQSDDVMAKVVEMRKKWNDK